MTRSTNAKLFMYVPLFTEARFTTLLYEPYVSLQITHSATASSNLLQHM